MTPADARGYVSLGTAVDLAPAVLATGCRAIAETLPAMPRTPGESCVPASRFAGLVPVTRDVAEDRHPAVAEAVAIGVARQVVSLIEDGSTLATPAVGHLPHETLRHLHDRRDLGFHGEVVTDAVLGLIEAGALTAAAASAPGRAASSPRAPSARGRSTGRSTTTRASPCCRSSGCATQRCCAANRAAWR